MEPSIATERSPFSLRNVRLFIAFRIFFNARFYYPVFTILFLDFGLTVSQFAMLNVVWAATIVILEVPSGALADVIGRRRLLVATGVIMVVEIGLLCVAPRGGSPLLFALFMLNRILSGTAEAAASGADEALAYDSLKQQGMESAWSKVLSLQMRLQSAAFVIAMALGAAVYDPRFMQGLADVLGLPIIFDRSITIRIPLILTWAMSLVTLVITLCFEEGKVTEAEQPPPLKAAFKLTWRAGLWIASTPFALIVITAGLLFDSIARMVITLASQYYRMIALPEATFGLIGAGTAMMGLFLPSLAQRLAEKRSPAFNLGVLSSVTLIGLFGMSFFAPIVGLVPALILFAGMYLTSFLVSYYLNEMTESSQRATVLSFKGLSYNLAYGGIGLLYALVVAMMRDTVQTPAVGYSLEDMVFQSTFIGFPVGFSIVLGAWILWAVRHSGKAKAQPAAKDPAGDRG
jgi:MFS family permease